MGREETRQRSLEDTQMKRDENRQRSPGDMSLKKGML